MCCNIRCGEPAWFCCAGTRCLERFNDNDNAILKHDIRGREEYIDFVDYFDGCAGADSRTNGVAVSDSGIEVSALYAIESAAVTK